MNPWRTNISRLFGPRAQWILGGFVVLVAVVPAVLLVLLDMRTSAHLVHEVDRGLRSDAAQYAHRFERLAAEALQDTRVRRLLETTGTVIPAAAAPDGGLFSVRAVPELEALIEYPFMVNLGARHVFPGHAAAYQEVSGLLGAQVAVLQQLRTAGGFRGPVPGPGAPFHTICYLDTVGIDNHVVLRGVKVDPVAVRDELIPAAFRRLAEQALAAEVDDGFASGVLGFEIDAGDTTLVLRRIASRFSGGGEAAIGTYAYAFDMDGLFPGWKGRILYFNELKANRWWRFSASIVPLLMVLLGVAAAARLTMREVELGRVKSLFVSNVSHELKTPITKIRFFNDMLHDQPDQLPEKRARYHEVISRECERLSLLIDNVLDFNQIEQGRVRYTFADVPIAEIVTEVVETFNVLYEDAGYTIHLEMDDELPTISADAGAVRQALINLLDNAVKYSTPHEVRVTCTWRRWNKQSTIVLSVQDCGRGIPKSKQELIFEEFYRVPDDGQRISGSGLGLPLVRHIVEGHGGRITVDSTVGRGSTFTMLLPVRPPRARRET